jgi:hypothetical protein
VQAPNLKPTLALKVEKKRREIKQVALFPGIGNDSCLLLLQVSYNAAGVLAHMASDGPAAWTINDPSRVDVLQVSTL